MKKWFLGIAAVGLLAACSSNENVPKEAAPTEDRKKEIEKDALLEDAIKDHVLDAPDGATAEAQIKKDSVPAVFAEIHTDHPPAGKRVKVVGKAAQVEKPEITGTFSLTADDGKYTMMLSIMNDPDVKKVKEGNLIAVYGMVSADKAKDGSPIIDVGIIE